MRSSRRPVTDTGPTGKRTLQASNPALEAIQRGVDHRETSPQK
jgi:hypothetical protein